MIKAIVDANVVLISAEDASIALEFHVPRPGPMALLVATAAVCDTALDGFSPS